MSTSVSPRCNRGSINGIRASALDPRLSAGYSRHLYLHGTRSYRRLQSPSSPAPQQLASSKDATPNPAVQPRGKHLKVFGRADGVISPVVAEERIDGGSLASSRPPGNEPMTLPGMGFWDLVRSDYAAAELRPTQAVSGIVTLSLFWLVFLYRIGHWLQQRNVPLIPAILRAVGVVLYGADLSPGARIGPGLRLVHGVGVVVGWDVDADSGLLLFQNVTLGGRGRIVDGKWCPYLGKNVTVGAGAVVLGPITVGDNVWIGANSVVIKSVPEGARVAGNPARVIRNSGAS